MSNLALLFVLVFFQSFYHWDHLAWEREGWFMSFSCICLFYFARVDVRPFSLPLGVGGWLRHVIVALPGRFYWHVCMYHCY